MSRNRGYHPRRKNHCPFAKQRQRSERGQSRDRTKRVRTSALRLLQERFFFDSAYLAFCTSQLPSAMGPRIKPEELISQEDFLRNLSLRYYIPESSLRVRLEIAGLIT